MKGIPKSHEHTVFMHVYVSVTCRSDACVMIENFLLMIFSKNVH